MQQSMQQSMQQFIYLKYGSSKTRVLRGSKI